ncbi:SCO family protein [Solibacillus sp. FSL H8-0523]|uniref:SCO family protein n=1 Tax=Solibacillus sp. FSL H8-0523 TaxID=2954511 RepID=UPI0031018134
MKKMALLFTALTVMMLGACSNYQFKATTNFELDNFNVQDHRENPVSLDSLKGEPWLAMFIFTNCPDICPPMTYNMKMIQDELIAKGVEDYKIVAFTVDPKRDTADVLKAYIDNYGVADESKWYLLNGYDQKFIEQYAKKSFKTQVLAMQDSVVHANTFYLVDQNGVAVKNYSGVQVGNSEVPFDTIVTDLETLIKQGNK